MVKCLPKFEYFTVFLKNRIFISKIRRSKVTDYAALMPELQGLGDWLFLSPTFISQKGRVSSDIHLNTWKYNVCSIKLETRVMSLHRIWI